MELSTIIIIIGISIVIWLIVSYYFLRWIFSIKRQLWNQKQTINILIRIAEKLGIDEYDSQLRDIHYKNNNPDDSPLK